MEKIRELVDYVNHCCFDKATGEEISKTYKFIKLIQDAEKELEFHETYGADVGIASAMLGARKND